MKPLKSLLFIQLITITGFAQKLTQRVYEGQINGKIPIVLTLTNDGNIVYGNVVYVKKGIPITVIGTQTSGQLFLNELMADGKVTGGYSAAIKGDKITGMWYGVKRDVKELTLLLAKTQEKMVDRKTTKDVTGSYWYSFGAGGSGNLRVQQLTPDQIAVRFMNAGSAPAYNQAVVNKTVLKLIDNRATYSNNEYGKCKFVITFLENGARVDYADGAYDCGFGNAAAVEGNYIKTNTSRPKFQKIE